MIETPGLIRNAGWCDGYCNVHCACKAAGIAVLLMNRLRHPYIELLALTALAAFFRLWRLDVTPPGLWFDEARNIEQFMLLLRGDYSPEFFDQEPLYVG